MDEEAGEGGGFASVCDHAVIIHRTVPVASRTPLLNHWLVCLVCGVKVCLSLHVTPRQRRDAGQGGSPGGTR